MKSLKNTWKKISEICKHPVWSKVIAFGIISLIAALWSSYSKYTLKQIYDFLIGGLSYKVPLFFFLSLVGGYFLIKLLIRLFKRKIDPIWEEQVGNYTFRELYGILMKQNFLVGTEGMAYSNIKPPEENLLVLFDIYSTHLNKGVTMDDVLGDGGYLYGALAPKLVGYGLVEKIEVKNPDLDAIDIKYQMSELGYKFYALLEKLSLKHEEV